MLGKDVIIVLWEGRYKRGSLKRKEWGPEIFLRIRKRYLK